MSNTKYKQLNLKRVSRIAMMVAIALIMYLLEGMIPPILVFAPGSKLGLSNVILLCTMILMGVADAFIVTIARILLSAIFAGNIISVIYSMPSSILSLSMMTVLYLFAHPKISIMAISFIGAVVFNFVQLFVASAIVQNVYIITLLPLMLLASTIAGLFVGLCAYFIIKYLPEKVYLLDNKQITPNIIET